MYIYHIFFIHSSVNEHLGCFHILAIVNSAATKIGGHVSFQIRVFVFSEYMPRSGVDGSYGNSNFSFLKRTSRLSSIVAEQIYISTDSVWRFPFLHTLSRALPSSFLDHWIKFLLCYTEPGFIWLSLVTPGKGPIEGSPTHWELVTLVWDLFFSLNGNSKAPRLNCM